MKHHYESIKFKFSTASLFLKDYFEKISNYSSEKVSSAKYYFNNIFDIVRSYQEIILDHKGTILTWNKEFENLEGYGEDEILGQNISLLYLPTERKNLPAILLRQAMNNGTATHFGKFIKKDGSVFFGSLKFVAIKKDKNELLGFMALCRKSTKIED